MTGLQLVQHACDVSVVLIITYAITTSALFETLRRWVSGSVLLFQLVICPYCTGWWAALAVAHAAGDIYLLTPLYFMALPVVRRLLPDFLTGPPQHEIDAFLERQDARKRREPWFR